MAPRLAHHFRHVPAYKETDIQWMFSWRWVMSESSTWWAKMVQNYSTRKLTFEGDELPAISGCARAMAALNKDTYYAGLWSKTMTNDLLWQSVDAPKAVRSKQYRAPSWSWAAIDGEVKCSITGKYNDLSRKLIQKLEFDAEYLSSDTFGQIKAMTLYLEGNPARVRIQDQTSSKDTEPSIGNKLINLIPTDPSCTCTECTKSAESLETLVSKTSLSAPQDQAPQPSSSVFTGMGESSDYMNQNKTTIAFTGLEGSELRNAGPQYTSTDVKLDQAAGFMGKVLLQGAGKESSAGVATFDVESEMENCGELWCLRVNPQFGLLVESAGVLVEVDEHGIMEQITRYKRVGLVKLNLSWYPEHELKKIALI